MKKSLLRILSICIAAVFMLAAITGCGGDDKKDTTSATTGGEAKAATGEDYTKLLGSMQDSSDLPDWTGKQLKLVEWYAHGTGEPQHITADKDVVGPEVKRVTGIELDAENSYDNGGNNVDVKMALLSAANDWPDFIMTSGPEQLKQMIMADKLYDLTDLLSKYCPDIVKKFDVNTYPRVQQKITADDSGISKRAFFVPVQAGIRMARKIADDSPDFDGTKWSNMQMPRPKTDWPRIAVRDDILKKMYPNARTQNEIEELFAKNGTFTREEIFDVPIKSASDFYKFLQDMKKLIDAEDIKIGGKPLEVTYAAFGGDNWQMYATLIPPINGMPTGNYFSYYDKETGKLEWAFKQDFFKEWGREFARNVATGVISQESLLDNGATFAEKLNAGRYAVTYGWSVPDPKALEAAGHTFRYRYIWPDIEYNYDKFVSIDGAPSTDMYIGIFKDSVAEEDLPQVLGWLNYMISDVGEKLAYWGPRSAGLFTETNGVRVFTDKELEKNMAYAEENKANLTYGLYNAFINGDHFKRPWPYMPYAAEGTMNHPRYAYSGAPKDKAMANQYFHPGIFQGEALEDVQVTAFKSDFLPDYSAQWDVVTKGRDAFEKALTATLAAKDDAQFDKLWQAMIETGNSVGMDDKALEEMNDLFSKLNPTFAQDAAKVSNKK